MESAASVRLFAVLLLSGFFCASAASVRKTVSSTMPVYFRQPFTEDPTGSGEEPDCCGCDEWIDNNLALKDEIDQVFSALPSCPCIYLGGLPFHHWNLMYDQKHGRNFKWREISDPSDLVYHPGASKCIEHIPDSADLPSQHCCYDIYLITRGSGAGSPRLYNSRINPQMHREFDKQPWLTCEGDWRKYQLVRPPNNGRDCPERPSTSEDASTSEYEMQIREAENSWFNRGESIE